MNDKRQVISVAGLLATVAMAVYMVVQLAGQTAGPAGDFTNAGNAEVRDAQGQTILRGQFALAEEEEEEDDDIERKAKLEPTGVDADANGSAEVEFSKASPAQQEIEFSVRNVDPGAALTFVIDGQAVGEGKADDRGRAEAELDVRMPGASAAR